MVCDGGDSSSGGDESAGAICLRMLFLVAVRRVFSVADTFIGGAFSSGDVEAGVGFGGAGTAVGFDRVRGAWGGAI